MDETSVGEAFASEAYPRTDFEAALIEAGAAVRVVCHGQIHRSAFRPRIDKRDSPVISLRLFHASLKLHDSGKPQIPAPHAWNGQSEDASIDIRDN